MPVEVGGDSCVASRVTHSLCVRSTVAHLNLPFKSPTEVVFDIAMQYFKVSIAESTAYWTRQILHLIKHELY